jgi:hypothetical protein
MRIEDMPLVMFEFVGGVLDGKTMCSDSADEAEARQVAQMYVWFCLGRSFVETSEQTDRRSLGIFRQPSPRVAELANNEQWSEAQRNAMMPYYNYRIAGWQEVDGLLMVRIEYADTDS